ncbi:DLW-39 family protein [Cellulomonas marina]|uniref:Uncharacterized protein n=1 Tax=Cellulomonas marina TaxID=988821 RepID=A0A1I1A8P7_9CELL|nr:DLW-39 family protein [Cellulomonas marina]GIG30583.1 hypothetical protein Cma02nite_31830 [Cellulomonas marina]SFB34334.1 hypothetical protein SAMN05421867_11610 [Cellulomonas marina]
MKRLLLVAALGAVAYGAYQRYAQDRDERELWAEVTDDVS